MSCPSPSHSGIWAEGPAGTPSTWGLDTGTLGGTSGSRRALHPWEHGALPVGGGCGSAPFLCPSLCLHSVSKKDRSPPMQIPVAWCGSILRAAPSHQNRLRLQGGKWFIGRSPHYANPGALCPALLPPGLPEPPPKKNMQLPTL